VRLIWLVTLLVGCGPPIPQAELAYCADNPWVVYPAAEAIGAVPPKPTEGGDRSGWPEPMVDYAPFVVPIDLSWWRNNYPDSYYRACHAAFQAR
jgi:hypothetical protein